MATSVPPTSVPPTAKVRNVCYTLNNYSEEDVRRLQALQEGVSYHIFAKEVAESGTPHLQGYIEFENPRATGDKWKNLKKLMGEGQHFEPRKGTAQQASDYCEFADYDKITHKGTIPNDWVHKFGEISRQGARTDWAQATNEILSGREVVDVIQEQPQLLPAIRALETLKKLSIHPIEREVHVTWLYGSPGSGKTRWVWTQYPDVYSKPSGNWWDGYNGEETLLLDDFDADIPFAELLKVLDRYKYRVQVKGGFVGARWTRVFITTNNPPDHFYKFVSNRKALVRRISEIKCFD
jgi:Putative viral replication protein./RNA helicase.